MNYLYIYENYLPYFMLFVLVLYCWFCISCLLVFLHAFVIIAFKFSQIGTICSTRVCVKQIVLSSHRVHFNSDGSRNTQRLFSYFKLNDWFLYLNKLKKNPRRVFTA
jgi:hypothetical protein